MKFKRKFSKTSKEKWLEIYYDEQARRFRLRQLLATGLYGDPNIEFAQPYFRTYDSKIFPPKNT